MRVNDMSNRPGRNTSFRSGVYRAEYFFHDSRFIFSYIALK